LFFKVALEPKTAGKKGKNKTQKKMWENPVVGGVEKKNKFSNYHPTKGVAIQESAINWMVHLCRLS
jgi:hypothetical protein